MHDHEHTPDDRPDPSDKRQEQLKETNDDISLVLVQASSNDGSNAEEEEVQDTTDDGNCLLARSVLGRDLKTNLLEDAHHPC